MLLGTNGEALWSVESAHDAFDASVEVGGERTLLLVVNGPAGGEFDLSVALPGV